MEENFKMRNLKELHCDEIPLAPLLKALEDNFFHIKASFLIELWQVLGNILASEILTLEGMERFKNLRYSINFLPASFNVSLDDGGTNSRKNFPFYDSIVTLTPAFNLTEKYSAQKNLWGMVEMVLKITASFFESFPNHKIIQKQIKLKTSNLFPFGRLAKIKMPDYEFTALLMLTACEFLSRHFKNPYYLEQGRLYFVMWAVRVRKINKLNIPELTKTPKICSLKYLAEINANEFEFTLSQYTDISQKLKNLASKPKNGSCLLSFCQKSRVIHVWDISMIRQLLVHQGCQRLISLGANHDFRKVQQISACEGK